MASENDDFHDTCRILTIDVFSQAHRFESSFFYPSAFRPWNCQRCTKKRKCFEQFPPKCLGKNRPIFPTTHHHPHGFFNIPSNGPKWELHWHMSLEGSETSLTQVDVRVLWKGPKKKRGFSVRRFRTAFFLGEGGGGDGSFNDMWGWWVFVEWILPFKGVGVVGRWG